MRFSCNLLIKSALPIWKVIITCESGYKNPEADNAWGFYPTPSFPSVGLTGYNVISL